MIDSSEKVLMETLLDGAGPVRMTRTEIRTARAGTPASWSSTIRVGVKRQTTPTRPVMDTAGDDDRGTDMNNKPTCLLGVNSCDRFVS